RCRGSRPSHRRNAAVGSSTKLLEDRKRLTHVAHIHPNFIFVGQIGGVVASANAGRFHQARRAAVIPVSDPVVTDCADSSARSSQSGRTLVASTGHRSADRDPGTWKM